MMKLRLALLLAALFFTSCISHPKPYDWSQYRGPGEEYFQREEVEFPVVHDTFEPLNRTMWGINERLAEYVLAPFGRGYRAIVPGPIRLGLRNFFSNALFPGRLVNNLLQGKASGAWDEAKRFGINTTEGLLGFRDVAQNKYRIAPSQEDFGQTFAKWGWRDSSYLMIPFYGPRTFRDVIGGLGDYAVDPAVYYFPAAPVRGSNKLSDEVRGLLEFLNSNYDPYELARLLYVMNRENDALDYSYEAEQSGVTDTLGAIFLAPSDPEFVNRSEERRVRLSSTGKDFPYSVWLQDKPAPLVYIVPGTGGHRNSTSSVALAEAAFSEGNSVVTVSNALNYEFIEFALTEELPGTMPSDSNDLHVALDAIDRDLQAYATHRLTNRYLGGLSLGALATLFIAAAEGSTDLVAFDAYVAINSPVSLRYSIDQLDAFYNAPLEYPADTRKERIDGIFRKTLDLAQGTLLPGAEGLPYTQLEAKFLIGLSFRNTVRHVIMDTQLANDHGVLKTPLDPGRRELAYEEISQFSFMEYFYAFLLPYFAEKREDITLDEAGAERLFQESGLRSLTVELRNNPKVRFISNTNDFLLAEGDQEFVTELLGEDRVRFFARGGHLGNLGREDIRQIIRAEALEALREE